MPEQSVNKRIAKNTIFLYIRMILVMVVSLYTTRVILATLGVDDYGIYNLHHNCNFILLRFVRCKKGQTMNTFIKASLIRCIRTICQTAVAVIGTAFVLADVNWWAVISASLLAGILSILTSVATGLPEVEYEQHLYMSADEPEDAEVDEDE